MPMRFVVLDDGLGNMITAWGVLTEEEVIEFFIGYFNQDGEKYRNYRYSISDYSAVAELDVSSDAVKRVAALSIESMKINPDAVVATVASDDYVFGLTRMWELLVDDVKWEIMSFRTLEDAKQWVRKKVRERYNITDLTFQ